MLKMKKVFGTLALVSAVVLLGACTNTAVSPTPSTPEPTTDIMETVTLVINDVPENDIEVPGDFNELPTVVVTDGKIVYTNAGSSTCAPVLESAVYENGAYNLVQKVYPADAVCTMDLRVFQQMVGIEGGEEIPENAVINLTSNETAEEVIVVKD